MSDGLDASKTQTSGGPGRGVGSSRVTRLQVVFGKSKGLLQVLDGSPLSIGRAGGAAQLSLDDGEASKAHASLELVDGQWWVVDQGSRNGTFVNGARCTRTPVRDGSVLRVGASVLLFEDVELPAYTALAAEVPTLPGPSLAMQRIRGELRLVAPQQIPVLVLGETGVGKELVAEELHRQSGRSGAFVPVNCAAISHELAESELFGHSAGAFTGARGRADGLFVAAHQGTLFLDEIGELPLELQPKLLRALARGEVRPVGSAETTRVDVRLVAATNRDLTRAAAVGDFRDDLLARLSGWSLHVPPLRTRRHDVLAFARMFLERRSRATEFDADVAEALVLYGWPYNVRELEQTITVAAVRTQGQRMTREHLPPALAALLLDRQFNVPPASSPPPLEAVIARDRAPTRDELVKVVEHFHGNIAQVADFFGKDRRQVYRWAEKFELPIEAMRGS